MLEQEIRKDIRKDNKDIIRITRNNKERLMVVDFGKRMDLAIVNIYFKKKDEHRGHIREEEKVPK